MLTAPPVRRPRTFCPKKGRLQDLQETAGMLLSSCRHAHPASCYKHDAEQQEIQKHASTSELYLLIRLILACNPLVPLYNCCPLVILFVKIVVLGKHRKKGFYHFKKFRTSRSVFEMLLLPQRSRNQASLSQQEDDLPTASYLLAGFYLSPTHLQHLLCRLHPIYLLSTLPHNHHSTNSFAE